MLKRLMTHGSRTLLTRHKLSTQARHQGAGIQWFMMKIEKIVLFGGHSGGPVIDTWQLEDNVWKEKQDIGPSYPVYSETVYSSNRIVPFGETTFSPGDAGAKRRIY